MPERKPLHTSVEVPTTVDRHPWRNVGSGGEQRHRVKDEAAPLGAAPRSGKKGEAEEG